MSLPVTGNVNLAEQSACDALFERTLLLDLEVSQLGEVLNLGAFLGSSTFPRLGSDASAALTGELEALGQRARTTGTATSFGR
jgi:hypothetical protein